MRNPEIFGHRRYLTRCKKIKVNVKNGLSNENFSTALEIFCWEKTLKGHFVFLKVLNFGLNTRVQLRVLYLNFHHKLSPMRNIERLGLQQS